MVDKLPSGKNMVDKRPIREEKVVMANKRYLSGEGSYPGRTRCYQIRCLSERKNVDNGNKCRLRRRNGYGE